MRFLFVLIATIAATCPAIASARKVDGRIDLKLKGLELPSKELRARDDYLPMDLTPAPYWKTPQGRLYSQYKGTQDECRAVIDRFTHRDEHFEPKRASYISKYTLPIIRYVSEMDYDAIDRVED